MLPLQQAYEVQHSILEYLKATFSFKDRAVHEAFYRFVTDSEDGIFKGPYVSLKLPFVKASAEETLPLSIAPSFPPYHHQLKSFQRLTTQNDHKPESTLITTGTSSGKTECFLYPILDYCFKNADRKGIKVIILYPMNALATDQAKRLAEAIWSDSRLKGKITAGLFIGEGKDKKKFPKEMGENHIIENRDTILDNPPDILLTNFKMLDYALMRNQFHRLWSFNFEDPTLMQFLVLDELHTYDGAQGTDVANLIRRLKLKLNIPKGQLCAVGTSATIGSGEDSLKLLTEYAEKVFGETFEPESVITENRLSLNEFFTLSDEQLETFVPRSIGLLDSRLQENETYANYIKRQKRLWQMPESLTQNQLGEQLKHLKLMKDLISVTGKEVISLQALLKKLADLNPDFRRLPEWDAEHEFSPREEIINSLLALISEARIGDSGKFPFLYLQIQIWVRELSGVLREMGKEPKFTWKDKVGDKYDPKALPAYYCRECGSSGWLGVKDDNKNHFFHDPAQVYEYFFNNHKNVFFINTPEHKPIEEYEPDNLINDYLHIVDMSLLEKEGPSSMRILAVKKLKDTRTRHICPECNTENTMGIIGTRVATLSSITVSQILASDLDPRTEKFRKILAFTNSVQDAAHQAGFVEARNYRFTFRASLQKVINQYGLLKLTDLQEAFATYWKNNSDGTGQNQEEAYYYRFFPADYHGKVDLDDDYRDAAKKFTKAFKQEFDLRMHWEIASEFGYNALIGRTLEKSGASAVKFDEEMLRAVYPAMKEWLKQNNLESINEDNLLPFVNGILHRVRTRGGVDHEYLSKFRSSNLRLWDLNWMKDTRHFLNKMFHPRARFPRILAITPHNQGLLDTTFTSSNNWFRSYFTKSFPMASNYQAVVNDFYQKLINVFSEIQLMNKKGEHQFENYALNPSAIYIENKVAVHTCDSCGSKLYVAASDLISLKTKCLDYSCAGTYNVIQNTRPNYYQLVYNRNHSPRIYATEHTGVLERKNRENKEIDFKERPKYNSLNAIVATSTLEMGIDIGTLNAAINNSVPPLTANFLQRVGRAGRSSGTALITNFAQSKAHDLFYYGEPKDMMEGEIATPGCYLEAKEILYRQFFAYCLDNWSSADYKKNSIPGRLLSLKLLREDLSASEFLINRIISFIKSNEDKLLDRFVQLYKEDISETGALNDLKVFLKGEGFYLSIKQVFSKLKEEYKALAESTKAIDDAIKNLPNDDERRELESEKKALMGLKRLLDKRSILEHLTNVGLLPNYAFPETGVTLNAWIKSNQAKGSNSIPTDMQFEIVRSSRSAIREFAPDNFFYSQGFRFAISGLNTYDWKDAGTLQVKRFCSNCDHIADKVVSNENFCPKCGDASWASEKNHHVFVKLTGVKSVNFRDKSTLDDSKDERESNQYRISRHLNFDTKSFQGAWGMKEIPFGIEYVKNVDITEVNLGHSAAVHANKITINQHEEVPNHGFITCKHCGKSTSKFKSTENTYHYGYCKHKDRAYNNIKDEVFEEVFLFREIKTEALKILLPVQEFESESTINMFKAGLELGLKKYYRGNPQHLSILAYSEYNSKNSRFDKYLVLHDNIPGGTGYLEKLFSPEEFTTVIKSAYEAIRNCTCKSKGKDGCYRCIYTYSNQFIQNELSRTKAEELFKRIVDKSNAWESYSTGLGALTSSGQIEESELEFRFIRSLKNYLHDQNPSDFGFEEFYENGIMNYKFKVTNGEFSYYYVIRPQFELGPANGVELNTRSDFYITLTSAEKGGIPLDDLSQIESAKSIAIYLDGYTYHATSENCRFYDDIRKRNAIAKSGSILSWSLTWNDLERFDAIEKDNDAQTKDFKKDFLQVDKIKYRQTIDVYRNLFGKDFIHNPLFSCRNSFERFLWLLKNPFADEKRNKVIALLLAIQQMNFAKPSIDVDLVNDFLADPSPFTDETISAKSKDGGNFYLIPNVLIQADFITVKLAIKVSSMLVEAKVHTREMKVNLDKEKWENFWQLYNLIQENL